MGNYIIDQLNQLMFNAAFECNSAQLRQLIECGVDVNIETEDGWTPIMFAAVKGFTEGVQILFDNGADINRVAKPGFTPLLFAEAAKQTEVVKLLRKLGARDCVGDFKDDFDELFYRACYAGDLEKAKTLLLQGANPNAKNNGDESVLKGSILKQRIDIIDLLLRNGAKVNEDDIMMAISINNETILSILRKYGANI